MKTCARTYDVALRVKREHGEWVVVYLVNEVQRDEAKTYYASDKEDAIGSAKDMARRVRKSGLSCVLVGYRS